MFVLVVLLSPFVQAASNVAYGKVAICFNIGDVLNFTNHEYTPTPPNEIQDVEVNVTFLSNPTSVIFELYGTKNYTVTESSGLEYSFNVGAGNYTAHDTVTWKWYAVNMYGDVFVSSEQSFIVGNRIPSVTAPLIDNENPANDETIICGSGIFSDPDSEDSEDGREYSWYVDNVLISGENSATLDISTIEHEGGEQVTCKMRVSDGYDYSAWTESSNYATLSFTAGFYGAHEANYLSEDIDDIAIDFVGTATASTVPYVPLIVFVLIVVGSIGYLAVHKP